MLPSKFFFEQKNNEYINWSLIDGLTASATVPTPVNDATITATMYRGRNPRDSDATPGAVIATSSLPYIALSKGAYRSAPVDASTWKVGGSYTLVVDATTPGGAKGHWEIPAEVRPRTT